MWAGLSGGSVCRGSVMLLERNVRAERATCPPTGVGAASPSPSIPVRAGTGGWTCAGSFPRNVFANCSILPAARTPPIEAGRQFTANREYAEAHHEQLKQQYPDQWVGIVRQQVLAHGASAEDVVRAVREANEDTRGMVLHHACVEEPIWIL